MHEINRHGCNAAGKLLSESISIRDGIWLCDTATILGGTDLGDNCAVAAGAIVRVSFSARSLIGQVPARIGLQL